MTKTDPVRDVDALVKKLLRVKSPGYTMRPAGEGHYISTNTLYHNPDGPKAATTITALQAEVARLRREVGHKDDTLHQKNLALDVMGWVWCDGGCQGGTGRFTDFVLTEEHVSLMEWQAKRARTFLANRAARTALRPQP